MSTVYINEEYCHSTAAVGNLAVHPRVHAFGLGERYTLVDPASFCEELGSQNKNQTSSRYVPCQGEANYVRIDGQVTCACCPHPISARSSPHESEKQTRREHEPALGKIDSAFLSVVTASRRYTKSKPYS